MIRGGGVIRINLKVCDQRDSGKRTNFFLSFLCLEKSAVPVDAWAICSLASYALSICCFVLGCVQKSVELPVHRPSLYEYEPLPDHTIGGFPQNLVKEKSVSNSGR